MSPRHFSEALVFLLSFSTLASCYAVSPPRSTNQNPRDRGLSSDFSTHISSTVEAGLKTLKANNESQAEKDEVEEVNSKDPNSSSPAQLDLRKRQSKIDEENPFPTDTLDMFICHINTPCVSQPICEAFAEDFEDVLCTCHVHYYKLGNRKHHFVGRCWDGPSVETLEDLLPRDLGDGNLLTPTGACYCNGSYASTACCGVRGGMVWEAPGLALFDLSLDGL